MEERGPIPEMLRKARERLELTIERAAADAGVPLRYARLLEGETPPGTGISDELYLIPFFRRYAAALGLPVEELLTDFLGHVQEVASPTVGPVPVRARGRRRTVWRPLLILVAIATASYVILEKAPERRGSEGWTDDEEHLASRQAELAPTTAPDSAPANAALGAAASASPASAAAPLPVAGAAPVVAAAPVVTAAPVAAAAAAATPEPERELAAVHPEVIAPPAKPRVPAAAAPVADAERAPASEPASTGAGPDTEASDVAAAGAGGGRELRIVAAQETWLALEIDDGPKRSILLQPGETRSWTATRTFTLTVGNAGGVTIVLDGRELPPLGRPGQVVRNLHLPQGETPPESG